MGSRMQSRTVSLRYASPALDILRYANETLNKVIFSVGNE